MSLKGRISKVKKHLFDAKLQLSSLGKKNFTESGQRSLDRTKDMMDFALQDCDNLKSQILSEQSTEKVDD